MAARQVVIVVTNIVVGNCEARSYPDVDTFKDAIARMAGLAGMQHDAAIAQLVKERKLVVEIQQARVPDIKSLASRKVRDWP